MPISQIILHVFPFAVPNINFAVGVDGDGEQITHWDEAVLGPQPSFDFLESKRAECEAARAERAEIESLETANQATLESNLAALLAQLRIYQTTASPTTAVTVATVKLLCRAMIYIVRLHLRKLDATT